MSHSKTKIKPNGSSPLKNHLELMTLLRDKDYPKNIIKLLAQYFHSSKRQPFIGSGGCMDRAGCSQQPVYKISCPGKVFYKASSSFVLPTADGFKYGWPDAKCSAPSVAYRIGSCTTVARKYKIYGSAYINLESQHTTRRDQGIKDIH